jgi:Protein ENHANCED DISEASE RESISTANCE 2, C-terminal
LVPPGAGNARQAEASTDASNLSDSSTHNDFTSPSSKVSGNLDNLHRLSGTVDRKHWQEIHRLNQPAPFRVRGLHYLRDKKKIPAGEPLFELAAMDIIMLDEPTMHIARYLHSVR